MKEQLLKEIEEQESKKMRVVEDNADYVELIAKGFPILYNISGHYQNADIEDKQAIIGSIFSEKLIFEENQYRTIQPNTIMMLTTATGMALAGLKKKQAREISDLFYSVVPPRIELGSKV